VTAAASRRTVVLGICLGLATALGSAEAAAAVDCSVSTTGVAFNIYDPLAAVPNDSTGSVSLACSYLSGGATQIAYKVMLSAGNSGTYVLRRLTANSNQLNYNLFSDAGRTTVWGDGAGGTSVMSGSFTVGPGVGNGQRQDSRTVYGRIPARQDVLDGAYTDVIIVTLEF